MSKGIFITGTDTGVGKTIVSAIIIRALIKKGIKVGAMKPVETGCTKTEVRGQGSRVRSENESLIPSDGIFLKGMAEMDDAMDLIVPIRYEYPLAPMVAAELENRHVDLNLAFRAYNIFLEKYDFMVVEGAGGLLVPIMKINHQSKKKNEKAYFTSDLIRDLGLPTIVVARPSLGTINHTLLTVREAERCGLKVAGVVINYSSSPENTAAEKTNPDVLRELSPVPILSEIPFMAHISMKDINGIEMSDNALDIILNSNERSAQSKVFI
jgi:dethiobiotin synthetase